MKERRPQAHTQTFLLLFILLIAFALQLNNIDRESLWRDEVDTLRFAAEIWDQISGDQTIPETVGQISSYLTQPGWNGPLYFLALEPWLRVAGQSELVLRLPSTFAGVLVVALGFKLGSQLYGPAGGRWSALLLAANPYLAWYAGEGKMYTGITALALLSTILLLKACRGGLTRHWLAYPAVTSLLFYTHILTPLFLPVQWILVLLLEGRAAFSRKALIATGVLVLPYLPLLLWQWPHIVEPAETGFPFVPLPTMALRMGNVFSRGIIGWPAGIALALLLGAMGVGLTLAQSECMRRKLRLGLGLLIWAALPIIELYLVSLRRPLFTERYLIWSLPGWMFLAAGGLAGLAQRGRVARLVSLSWTAALVVIALIGIGRQWGTPVRADFRSATALVAEHYQVGDLIVFQIPYLQATFDYYAPELIYQGAEGPYTNWGNPPEEIAAYMQAVTAGYPRIWLVLSESTMWDARNLTIEWFQDHAHLQRTAVFNRVEVTEWQLGSGE